MELCGGYCVWLTKEKREWLSGRYVCSEWDTDELENMKDEIVKGDNQGTVGYIREVASYKDGVPVEVFFMPRNSTQGLPEKYENIRNIEGFGSR